MSKKIKFGLSPDEIQRAIDEVNSYKAEFLKKCYELVEALTDEGVKIAKVQVAQLDAIDTGELMNSIQGYYSPTYNVGIIRAGSLHAVFVEFGTGVVGAGQPHPNPMPGWNYDSNGHGDKGWVYFDDVRGKFRWTKGFKSRPFMYNTARELERECARIAREVFKR